RGNGVLADLDGHMVGGGHHIGWFGDKGERGGCCWYHSWGSSNSRNLRGTGTLHAPCCNECGTEDEETGNDVNAHRCTCHPLVYQHMRILLRNLQERFPFREKKRWNSLIQLS